MKMSKWYIRRYIRQTNTFIIFPRDEHWCDLGLFSIFTSKFNMITRIGL